VTGVPLSVLVTGGSPLVRSVLRASLVESAAGRAAVAVAEDPEDVVALCSAGVQVLVAGTTIDGAPLAEVMPRVLASSTRVLVVCNRASAGLVPELLLRGASGYLVLEECRADELWTAVQDAAAGVATLHPGIATLILEQWREARAASRPVLTTKETEVLQAMQSGDPVKSIARELGLSARTVDAHRSRIYVKLGVRSHAQAVQRALDLGLLS
jgi:two-component system nitrate/nitrite response regulator NarL